MTRWISIWHIVKHDIVKFSSSILLKQIHVLLNLPYLSFTIITIQNSDKFTPSGILPLCQMGKLVSEWTRKLTVNSYTLVLCITLVYLSSRGSSCKDSSSTWNTGERSKSCLALKKGDIFWKGFLQYMDDKLQITNWYTYFFVCNTLRVNLPSSDALDKTELISSINIPVF